MQTMIRKSGLFPATDFERRVFRIENGQPIPKQISIINSNTLIFTTFFSVNQILAQNTFYFIGDFSRNIDAVRLILFFPNITGVKNILDRF